MRVLGIETSCDETAVAVVDDRTRVVADFVYSQTDHDKFGGIVPEIASRQQLRKIIPLFQACKEEIDISPESIDGIAVTSGPGLIGSLMVGLNFAKALSYGWGVPFVGVNHLEGHIFANCLADPDLEPPFLCLVVSGGHTLLVHVRQWGIYSTLGATRDDAAGEAFDMVAKLLGLGYPGGDKIDRLSRDGDRGFTRFPKAQFKSGEYEFSFSGLKTAVALYLKQQSKSSMRDHLADICATFQENVVEVLVDTTLRAAHDFQLATVAVGGGVAANSRLRELFEQRCSAAGIRSLFPDFKYCTDNAAMIASVGCFRLAQGETSELNLRALPYWPLGE